MAAYSVFAPPLAHAGSAGAERFKFIRDGFSWSAFILGPIWMVFHRLVLSGTASLVSLLVALLIGLEASSLRSWTLKRRGWREIGIVVADELEAAERRFFDELHNQDAVYGTLVPGRVAILDRPQGASDVIGLFPESRGSR
jgi:hypothetical protein